MTTLGEPTALFEQGLDEFELIGRGGSSTVYRATDVTLGRLVAVKVLHVVSLGGGAESVPAEALAQSRVSWHSNVLTLFRSTVAHDGSPVLVLEYAPGGSLDDRVATRGPLTHEELLVLGEELAGALVAAHEQGVVHCDIKPSNVLFAADGSARLADFGIARHTSVAIDTLDPLQASLQFAPPELLEGARPTPANDVYALAVTLCFAAAGELPFGGPDQGPAATVARIQAGDIKPEVLEAAPEELRGLLRKAMSSTPADRPSAEEVRRRCVGAVRGGNPPPTVETGGRSYPRRLLPVLLVVGALLAGVIVAARTERPVEKVVAAPDLCAEFEKYVGARKDLLVRASEDLEQATSPTEVIRRLLVSYPADFSRIVRPFIDSVARIGGTSGDVTSAQLAKLASAENLRTLGGGKPFIFDGQSGAFDPAAVPMELQLPALMFSEANSYAVERCGSDGVELGAGKARLASAIYSNLANPEFMDAFYDDPESLNLLDASSALIMAAMAWDFFESILIGHYDWLLELLERKSEIRRSLALEYPETYLRAASAPDALAPEFLRPAWRADIIDGIQRSSSASRIGMRTLYPEQIALLGI